MRETIADVIGIGHRCEVALVTTVTVRRCIRVSRRMTSDTLQSGVTAGEQEACGAVIKHRRCPGCSRMTGHAIVIKVVGDVIRIGDAGEISLMARIASR